MNSAFPQPGEVFASRYRIDSLLGSGGFSRVYRAVQLGIERVVAIKVMRPESAGPDDCKNPDDCLDSLARRFEREAKAISELRSPHTITMYDFGRDEERGVLFMVLEYIDGEDLEDLVMREGALAPARVVSILEKVLESLREAHCLGMVHRDIKPQNIMLYEHMGARDCVKLLDFGIAKHIDEAMREHTRELTSEGMLLGTPTYMAPEYISGDAPIPASDLYSLGLVAFKLLTGHAAINAANSSIQILGQHLSPRSFVIPTDADICPELRAVINTMLAKDLGRRYSSAEEVLDALDELSHLAASGYRRVTSSEDPHTEPLPTTFDDPRTEPVPEPFDDDPSTEPLDFLSPPEPELFPEVSPEPRGRISERFSAVAFIPEEDPSPLEGGSDAGVDVVLEGEDVCDESVDEHGSNEAPEELAGESDEPRGQEPRERSTASSGPLLVVAACAVIACSLGVWALSFGPGRADARPLEPTEPVAQVEAPAAPVATAPSGEVPAAPEPTEEEQLVEPDVVPPKAPDVQPEERELTARAVKKDPRGARPKRRSQKKPAAKAAAAEPARDELGAELELLRRGFE